MDSLKKIEEGHTRWREQKRQRPKTQGRQGWMVGGKALDVHVMGVSGADRKPERFWGPDWRDLEGIPSRRLHFVFWPLGIDGGVSRGSRG